MPTRSSRRAVSVPPAALFILALAFLAVRCPAPDWVSPSGASDRLSTVYLVLEGEPVAARAAVARRSPERAGPHRSLQAHARTLLDQQASLQEALAARGARVTGQFTRVAHALRVQAKVSEIPRLATLPGVRRVHLARLFTRRLSASLPFVGAPTAWSTPTEGDGRGIRIGIVDSGIDYTHADFGGSGEVADFTRNDPTRIEPGTFPTAKVIGGFDFAGDRYDPGSEEHAVPAPDADPLDCAANGHGTHVAGIAAGLGVLADGTPYAGPYHAALEMTRFLIAPGVAPGASLVALKVFGCAGSTSLVTDALEWAADPNGDYDFSDRLDVVNLSLGGDFGTLDPEDTDVVAANHLAELGCVVVCAAGNSENIFFAVGSPGIAPRAMSVANSIVRGEGQALEVLGPSPVAGSYFFVEAAITPSLTNAGPISGRLVYIDPPLGCSPPENARDLAGSIALIDRGTCLFSEKILHAQAAGALAVVMINNLDTAPIPMGGDGTGIHIPGGMISRADGDLLKIHLGSSLTVRLDATHSVARPEFVDTLDDGSSRGPASPDNRLKPDLSAPGANLVSAKAGSGTEGIPKSGTSMASPMVAGAAALLRQRHPDWRVDHIKAALMNCAQPLANPTGIPYPESRMGAGRLNLAEAVRTQVTAAAADDSGVVSVSFGALQVAGPLETTRTVRLAHDGDVPLTLHVDFSNTVSQAGVEFLPANPILTVPARGSVTTEVRLRVDPTTLRHPVPDDTTAAGIGAGTVLPRHVLGEVSGQLWFHHADGSLHVPCHASLRPANDHRSDTTVLVLPPEISSIGTPDLTLRFLGTQPSTNVHPLVSAFQLGVTSPDKHLADANRAAVDLVAVGAATDVGTAPSFDEASVYFGLATAGSWTTPQPELAQFYIQIDRDLDGEEDVVVFNGNGAITNRGGALDAFMSIVLELDDNYRILATNAVAFLNHYPADERDTAVFNNSVLVLPVPVAALGVTRLAPSFRYQVVTFAPSGSVDETGWIPFNPLQPVIDTAIASPDGSPFHEDGFPLVVRLDREAAHRANQRLPAVLLLHHHGLPGKRHEVVTLDLALEDTDGDRLPDWWEQAHFAGLDRAGSNSDVDGDSAPDRHEFAAGTDPLDPVSLLRMRSASRVSTRNISVRWSGATGQVFTLERATNLLRGFTEIVRDDIRSTPPLNSITDTNAPAPGPYFYRVRLKN